MRGLTIAPILSYGREIGQFTYAGRSTTQEGSSCTTGSRRKYTLSWTTNSAVNDSDFNVKIYEEDDGGGEYLVTTVTDPKTTESYVREVDYYSLSGQPMREINFRLELIYTPATPDEIDDDTGTSLDEGEIWWGYYCS